MMHTIACPACGEPQPVAFTLKPGVLERWAQAISDGTHVCPTTDDLDVDLIPLFDHMLCHND